MQPTVDKKSETAHKSASLLVEPKQLDVIVDKPISVERISIPLTPLSEAAARIVRKSFEMITDEKPEFTSEIPKIITVDTEHFRTAIDELTEYPELLPQPLTLHHEVIHNEVIVESITTLDSDNPEVETDTVHYVDELLRSPEAIENYHLETTISQFETPAIEPDDMEIVEPVGCPVAIDSGVAAQFENRVELFVLEKEAAAVVQQEITTLVETLDENVVTEIQDILEVALLAETTDEAAEVIETDIESELMIIEVQPVQTFQNYVVKLRQSTEQIEITEPTRTFPEIAYSVAEQQPPFEKVLAEIAVYFSDHEPVGQAEQVVVELIEQIHEAIEEYQSSGEISEDLAVGLTALLEVLGYDDPPAVLRQFVEQHNLGYLFQAIECLHKITNEDNRHEFLIAGYRRLMTQQDDKPTLAARIGNAILGSAKPLHKLVYA